jgi:hypothetical protein
LEQRDRQSGGIERGEERYVVEKVLVARRAEASPQLLKIIKRRLKCNLQSVEDIAAPFPIEGVIYSLMAFHVNLRRISDDLCGNAVIKMYQNEQHQRISTT